jgi:hypothetical protein
MKEGQFREYRNGKVMVVLEGNERSRAFDPEIVTRMNGEPSLSR